MAFSYKDLTCRTWKLNPAGCYDGPLQCKYSHRDTGVISPAAAITCLAWSQGDCALRKDDCIFAHSNTGLVISEVQKVYLHGKVHSVIHVPRIFEFTRIISNPVNYQGRTGNHLRQKCKHRTSSSTSRIRFLEGR